MKDMPGTIGLIGLEDELEQAYTIIEKAKKLCEKFVWKVEHGRAYSKETYAECKELLELINDN